MAKEETITISKAEYASMQAQIQDLSFQLAELKRLVFGSKSERFIRPDPQQGSLFDLPQVEQAQPKKQTISYTRDEKKKSKKHPLRMELPSHLPRRSEVVEPEGLVEGANKIGEEVTEILEYEPASIFVRQIIRPKYVISSDDEHTDIQIAELPSLPIPKGNAGPGLLSHILISKFIEHLPFYRQRQRFKRQGLEIPESTIGGWFSQTCRLLLPLYLSLKDDILKTDYLMADETPIPVLTKDKPGSTHKGYHWLYYDPVRKLVLFDYRKTRSREGPNEILADFEGFLQTDGYVGYTQFEKEEKVQLLTCAAHCRRKFESALENDHDRATKAMTYFQKLYAIERIAKENELDYSAIKELREKEAKPILDEMEFWLKQEINLILPQSAIGKAFAYTLKLWSRLVRYIEDGRFQIDNNLIENSVRVVALGRRNYMFAGSHDGAQNAAMIYSLLATCKIRNIEPYQWLKDTLEVIQDHPADKLADLLPGNNK
ncbi:MAG: IS66 family transposase [Bacteroidota bacterium]|nr:IS66 family transposase [Bacteroidota bacterium]